MTECDTFDEWNSVRLQLAGACQALIFCRDRGEDWRALNEARGLAFENGIDCIKAGKYEGATA